MVAIIYTFLAIFCFFLFGGSLDEGSDVMDNINSEGKDYWESFILRFLFLIVLACHIPFIFFSGKEALLIMIDEFNNQSISSALEIRIK